MQDQLVKDGVPTIEFHHEWNEVLSHRCSPNCRARRPELVNRDYCDGHRKLMKLLEKA